jgi:hypothetical protein
MKDNYHKYLKYKNKYLHKINQIGSGIFKYPIIYPPIPMARVQMIPNYIVNIEINNNVMKIYYINGAVRDIKMPIVEREVIREELKTLLNTELGGIEKIIDRPIYYGDGDFINVIKDRLDKIDALHNKLGINEDVNHLVEDIRKRLEILEKRRVVADINPKD